MQVDTIELPIRPRNVFRLFDLPTELRIKIYDYAILNIPKPQLLPFDTMGMHHRKIRSSTDEWQPSTTTASWVQPPVTRLCQEIRNHTLPFFYTLNNFELDYCAQLDRGLKSPTTLFAAWLGCIGTDHRSRLRSVVLFDGPHTVFTMGDELWRTCFRELGRKLARQGVRFQVERIDSYGRHRIKFLN